MLEGFSYQTQFTNYRLLIGRGRLKSRSNKEVFGISCNYIKHLTIEEDLPVDDVMNQIEKKLFEITQDSIVKDFRGSKDIALSFHRFRRDLNSIGENSKA